MLFRSVNNYGDQSGPASISTVDEIEIAIGRSSEEESGIFFPPDQALPQKSKIQRKKFYIKFTLVVIVLALVVLMVMLIILIIPLLLATSSPNLPTASPSTSTDSYYLLHSSTLSPSSLVRTLARPTRTPTTSASSNSVIRSYLRTSGNQIMDNSGATVRITGINWSVHHT